MNEIRKEKALTTADLAAANRGAPMKEKKAPRPAAPREYVEEPARKPERPKTTAPEIAPDSTPLFSSEEAQQFRSEWDAIQIAFVDEPRKAVERADGLVAQVIQRLAEVFADERGTLEGQWSRGADVSTEDLRVALQRYRSFFGRLLSV